MPLRAATLALLALAALSGLSACGGGGGSSDNKLVLPTTTAFPGGQGQATNVANDRATMANTPMSRRLLSGRFRPPSGFTLRSVNPSVPTGGLPTGAVQAILASPTGVEYIVMFGPTIVPCFGANCNGTTRTIPVGSANPQPSSAVFAPDIGMSAECGYDSDGHQVGCDTIVRDEYVSVRASATAVSTTDAVAVLRAAIVYVNGLSPT